MISHNSQDMVPHEIFMETFKEKFGWSKYVNDENCYFQRLFQLGIFDVSPHNNSSIIKGKNK